MYQRQEEFTVCPLLYSFNFYLIFLWFWLVNVASVIVHRIILKKNCGTKYWTQESSKMSWQTQIFIFRRFKSEILAGQISRKNGCRTHPANGHRGTICDLWFLAIWNNRSTTSNLHLNYSDRRPVKFNNNTF